jgi:endonuclease/exonuclease/phosphatase family metal-dependent hydrolase
MKSRNKRTNFTQFITGIFLFSHVVVLMAFIFSLLAGIIPTDKLWIFSFFGLIFLPLYIANIGFTALWMIMRRKFWLISVIPLILGFMTFRGHFNLHFASNHAMTSGDIKVMTFNVRGFEPTTEPEHDELAHKSFLVIENEHPDIACFQDFTLPFKGKYSVATLQKLLGLPYSACRNYSLYSDPVSVSGVAVFSKYPIIDAKSVDIDSGYICVSVDIQYHEQKIRVLSIHLQSYSLYTDEKVILRAPRTFGNFDEHRIKRDSRKIAWKLRWGLRRRAPEARKIAEFVKKSPYPVILCGDFNDTPASYAYKTISKSLVDPFPALGSGIACTYNESKYPFRIDYILHSKHFKSLDYHIIPTKLSDHNPVTAVLRME